MTSMTQAEKQAFLADVHVGVLALNDGDRGPLMVPMWYDYEPGGELWFLTGSQTRKGRLIQVGTRVSLVAQTEDAPYRYVSVEGPVTAIAPADPELEGLPMAVRYLGPEKGKQYFDSMSEWGVTVRVRPERWLAVDYSKS
ncbi:uncharacterized protein METZ01_LOCUS429518 [marine metagenome]|uniref:Pyridoxamine 5'-phosphate oxidase N-terminal domain-containing protein n=1 Tax=marine metagenome TaxID=408172 RepID=A0A382Y0H0_9ZZZZ